MKHFDFKERNLISGPHLLGLLLVFTGFFVLVSPAFLSSGSSIEKVLAVGMCSVIIGLLIVLTYKGTLIDFEEKKFKKVFFHCRIQVWRLETLATFIQNQIGIQNLYQ